MTTEVLTPTSDTLPHHQAIGFRDEPAPVIDGYVAGASERIDEAVTERIDDADDIEDIKAIATEIVVEEVAEALSGVVDIDPVNVKDELRRREIRAAYARKRQLARPILSYAAIYTPPQRH